MASLSTCHLGLWLGWQILLNLWGRVALDLFYSSGVGCSLGWLLYVVGSALGWAVFCGRQCSGVGSVLGLSGL